MASVRKRTLSNGTQRWAVLYRRDGRQTSETFTTAKKAATFKAYVDLHGAERARALWDAEVVSDAPTLEQWAAQHIAHLTGVTDGTRRNYERMFARSWAPLLGRHPVDVITQDMVRAALLELNETWSDKTVRNHHGLLAAIMESAVVAGHLAASPCKGVRLPRRTAHREREMRFLTHAEFARLRAAVPGHYLPLLLTLAGTGARWGELEALTVADVDVDACTLRINKAAKWNGASAVREVGPTKTKRSKRTVTLPPEVLDVLRPLLGRPRTATLFLDEQGRVLRNRRFWDVWRRVCTAAGLDDPRPRVHDLRHTHASWLIAQGVPLPVIQARLGHESITTTIDRYGHLVPELQLAAANAASVALRPTAVAPTALPSGRPAGAAGA